VTKARDFYCSEFCIMDAYDYQAGAELDHEGPARQTTCHYCGGQILALAPAYYATGLGETNEQPTNDKDENMKLTISKKTLEVLTREVLDIWECDYLDLTNASARKIITALDEAIEALGIQPELDAKAEAIREAEAAAYRARRAAEAAENSEAN
jgi:hypothetical protein